MLVVVCSVRCLDRFEYLSDLAEPGNFSVAFQEAMRQQTAGKPLVVDDRLSVYLDHCIMSRSVDALLAKEVSGGNLCSYDRKLGSKPY